MALKQELRALSGRRGEALEQELGALLAGCIEARPSAPTIERLKWYQKNPKLALGKSQPDQVSGSGETVSEADGYAITIANKPF